MTDAVPTGMAPVPKTTEGLRDALFEEINLLRSGASTPGRARAVAQMARQVIDSIRVQIQFQRLLGEKGKQVFLGTSEADNGKKKTRRVPAL